MKPHRGGEGGGAREPGVVRGARVEGAAARSLGDRWLAPLLDRPELRQQVRRGRILARKGAVRGLEIRSGLLLAEVTSELGEVHSVKIRMDPIDGPTWALVVEAISGAAALAAELLRGRLSDPMIDLFEEAGHDLFPFDLLDVSSYCSCREDAKVCTGAVATHIHFAEIIDADPMKLLTFRGRAAERIERDVQERRGGKARAVAAGGRKPSGAPARSEPQRDGREPAPQLAAHFWERGALPLLAFHVAAREVEDAESFPVVRALGPAPGDMAAEEVARALAPTVRTAQRRLDAILGRTEADAGGGQAAVTSDEVHAVEEEELEELLLAAARRQGHLTTSGVAAALGVNSVRAREFLNFLVDSGKLELVGRARGTRYVPVDSDETDDLEGP